MPLFLLGIGLLAGGYIFYGRWIAAAIRPDPARPTPALRLADGVDFVAMPTWRVALVQLLNIAGLGPVFGPIMGALWGPQVFLWVVLGAILGGAVHDFLAGAMSVRNDGAGLPALIGRYLGRHARQASTVFILVLMVLVGTVFVKAPAALIAELLPAGTAFGWLGPEAVAWLETPWQGIGLWQWVIMALIFAYYLLATLLPIDKIIGRVYPIFALALLVMVFGLAGAMLFGQMDFPAFSLANLHPAQVPAWPIIFITVSCGAISGFHATQSPLMARCLSNERHMRPVFYGAMIAEGLIALIWASAAQGYYGGVERLAAALGPGLNDAAVVVHTICTDNMGAFGGMLAVLGVVVLPITSGDTAFRVARLILGDALGLPQKKVANRYLVALPLFGLSLVLMFLPFGVIWRYFGWANQTLAAVALWTGAVFLARRSSRWWLAALPATFMTTMTTTFLLVEERAKGCLGLDPTVGTAIGLLLGAAALGVFLWRRPKWAPETDPPLPGPAGPTEADRLLERQADRLGV
jgi:carbon starvation protein CstA